MRYYCGGGGERAGTVGAAFCNNSTGEQQLSWFISTVCKYFFVGSEFDWLPFEISESKWCLNQKEKVEKVATFILIFFLDEDFLTLLYVRLCCGCEEVDEYE